MKKSVRNFAVGSALVASAYIAGAGGAAAESLSPEQTVTIDKAFALGRMGLDVYQQTLEINELSTQAVDTGGFLSAHDSNIGSFPGKVVPLGESIRIGEQVIGLVGGEVGSYNSSETITPSRTETSSTVAYSHEARNMAYDGYEGLTLANPDPNFFGDDNAASPQEMLAFYNDPQTRVESAVYHNDDILNGSVDFSAVRFGGRLYVEMSESGTSHKDSLDITSANIVDTVKDDVLYE